MASTPSLVHSDLQLRARKEKTRSRIVIPLSSKPRKYVPGSGPPLQSICLLPPQDSTAYIVERILLPSPGMAADGKPLPRRMTYIIGWRDLPAARLLVPAMQILDYVPPRSLEEWESQMELELDEDRKKLAEEKESGEEKKARPPAHTDIEFGAVAEPESDTPTRHKMGAMSLSTPQKARLQDFEDLSEYENGSPSRQIASEAGYYTAEEMDTGEMYDTPDDGREDEGWDAVEIGLNTPLHKFKSDIATEPVFHNRPNIFQDLQTASDRSSRTSTDAFPHADARSPVQTGGFTPFNYSQRKSQSFSSVPQESLTSMPAAAAKRPAPSEPPKPRKRPAPSKSTSTAQPTADDNNGEPAWVVQRLEDVQVYEVEGKGIVRYFQVRWEGDWPPDQNPTWEPEENIPPALVRNFFKRSKKRRRATARRNRVPFQRKVSLGEDIHYKSVSEAFAGDVADDLPVQENGGNGQYEEEGMFQGAEPRSGDDDEGQERDVFVIEEEQPRPAQPAVPVADTRRSFSFGFF